MYQKSERMVKSAMVVQEHFNHLVCLSVAQSSYCHNDVKSVTPATVMVVGQQLVFIQFFDGGVQKRRS